MRFQTAAAAQAIGADLRAVKRDLRAAVAAECHVEARRLQAEEARLRNEYQLLIWEVVQREERALRTVGRFRRDRVRPTPA